MSEHRNIHGRAWGRGLRPWLLLPKYFAVSVVIGGLVAVTVLDSVHRSLGITDGNAGALIGAVFLYAIVPATVAAIVLGILLLLQHPLEFLRMRWMRVKFAAVAIVVPLSHLLLRFDVKVMQASPPAHVAPDAAGALTGFALIAILGRLKPRLGQGYGKQVVPRSVN